MAITPSEAGFGTHDSSAWALMYHSSLGCGTLRVEHEAESPAAYIEVQIVGLHDGQEAVSIAAGKDVHFRLGSRAIKGAYVRLRSGSSGAAKMNWGSVGSPDVTRGVEGTTTTAAPTTTTTGA